ncbi:MAG: imidazole glycerol phosphate synthase subunit HisF, partial [Betaproteobacteria bacterium]|nr:imidazole glycerol phosphate synthase subunit HisF [Betaproteobacteria bacterium]
LLTSMDQDGTKKGFDVKLTRAMSDALEIPIIASGGVGTAEHFVKGVIDGRADALLAASVFHYGELSVREVKETMSQAGIEVRL